MIRKFKIEDLDSFDPNEYSDPQRVRCALDDATYEVQTLELEGKTMAVLCFQNYWGRNWHGFFLIAKGFTPRMAFILRSHIRHTMEIKDALRLQTDSVDCKILNDWHEFLGFQWEGCRRKMMFNRDYCMWALMRGGV